MQNDCRACVQDDLALGDKAVSCDMEKGFSLAWWSSMCFLEKSKKDLGKKNR